MEIQFMHIRIIAWELRQRFVTQQILLNSEL